MMMHGLFGLVAFFSLSPAANAGWQIVQEQAFVGPKNQGITKQQKLPGAQKSTIVTDFDGGRMRVSYGMPGEKSPIAKMEMFYAGDDIFYFCFGKADGGTSCSKDTVARLMTTSRDLGAVAKIKYTRHSVEATGKKRTLGGLGCIEYLIQYDLAVEVLGTKQSTTTRERSCHAAELVPKVSAKAMKDVDKMYASLAEPAAMAGLKKFGTLGMPLEVTPEQSAAKTPIEGRRLTLVSATAKAFGAKHFQLPAGYTVSKDGLAGLATGMTPDMLTTLDPETMRSMGISEKDIEAYKAAMGKASQLKPTKKKGPKAPRSKPSASP